MPLLCLLRSSPESKKVNDSIQGSNKNENKDKIYDTNGNVAGLLFVLSAAVQERSGHFSSYCVAAEKQYDCANGG